MKDIVMKIIDEPFIFLMIIIVLMLLLSMCGESRTDKKLRIYRECMEVKNADVQTCKELAGVKSNNR